MATSILGSRYKLTEKIGTGGMADVYKAIDETLGRTVAVKVMHTKYASDPSFTERFRQEAQAAANLQSPNIVNIYDWGQEGALYYIVMEYVRGTELKSLIQQKGALPSRQVADIGAQVCVALSVAHGYDIIHRDIKPQNIMVAPDGMVKVMDFGIARAGNTAMTQTGSVLGTAHYVSPEQAQGRELTSASDLYSLGVVLYEAATGRVPFDADTPVAVALKHVNEQAPRPSRINPGIDPRLELVIGRAMAKDPRARYATAEDMRRDLQRIVDGTGDTTTVLPGAAVAAGAAAGMAAGVAGANDATTVLPEQVADGTTVMPAVGTAGGPIGPDGKPMSEAEVELAKRKKRNKIIAAVLGVCVLAAVVVAVFAYSGVFGVRVPNVVDIEQDEAVQKLEEAGFTVTIEEKFDPVVEEGRVVRQDPRGGTFAAKESEVTIVVSLGIEMGHVPNIVGMSEVEAREALTEAGFEPDPQPGVTNAEVPAGHIISQDPAAGEELAKGSRVAFVPSLGAERAVVPDVRGKGSGDARNELEAAGFIVEVYEQHSDTVAEGVVISQNPGSGTQTVRGATVTITVSLGKQIEYVTVPEVRGSTEGQATTILRNAGFQVSVAYVTGTGSGNVLAQNPAAGAQAERGTTVTIEVDKTSSP